MSFNPSYPSVFRPNPANERVSGSTPLLPAPYSSSVQAQPGQGQDYVTPQQWDQYIQTIKDAYAQSSGFERTKLEQQYADAEKGRQNSLKIAQLQADNSRYGYDQQRQTAIDQLKQRDREFAANHELDVSKLTGYYQGQPTLDMRNSQLNEAQLIAQQRSQPNRLFQTMDLEQALGSIRAGRPATTMPMTGVAAVNQLSSDYTGNPYLTGGGGGQGVTQQPTGTGSASGASTDVGASAQGPDPRQKALQAVMTALPPSATEGLDPTGVAALNAAYHIYSAPGQVAPGKMQSLSPTQKATFQSAGERLQGITGISPDDFYAQYTRNGIGQQSPLSY